MQNRIVPFIALFLLIPVLAAQAAMPDFQSYLKGVAEYFQADESEVQEVASYLVRTDEAPVAYMIARKAGVSPMDLARKRESGTNWTDIMGQYHVGADLFRVEVRGFVPSAVFQPILDKYPAEKPQAWAKAPVNDRDLLNLANLIFIRDHYGYSQYRVMAMRDKGQGYPSIQSAALDLAQGEGGTHKTSKAAF